MGKNKKMKQQSGGSQHSPATVFVSNLPYTFSNSQLEETFSDVGPIRRCFMVTQKGSTEHRGFGFVQFAVNEDANRAIELKHGTSIGGRTIGVKLAAHRAPLEQRRAKGNEVVPSGDTIMAKDSEDDIANDVFKMTDDSSDDVIKAKDHSSTPTVKHKQAPDSQAKGKIDKPKKAVTPSKNERMEGVSSEKHMQGPDSRAKGKDDKLKKAVNPSKNERMEGVSSEKQRVARTVVIGGLTNDDMAEDAHRVARECGSVTSLTYPLPKEEITHHGLVQDGCRLGASSIVYASVKSARACVTKLHQKTLSGGMVWARQLGGEGSKVQKWKLIIRNLPFKANVNEIKEMFSAVGFVWDVFIPKKPDSGLSKGFAFVKFTCKQDAENAIQKFNGKPFGKRPIAVDWAIPKKIYTAGSQASVEDGQEASDEDDFSSDLEDDHVDTDKKGQAVDSDPAEKEVNFDEEADVARKVLSSFLSSSNEPGPSANDDSVSPKMGADDETVDIHKKIPDGPTNVPHASKPQTSTKTENTKPKPEETEEELQRTLFICNLPFDTTNEEVKQRFTAFGEVQSFVPVLHPVTKRPRGTGFLKFKTIDAAEAAFSAATSVAGFGVILKGRQLKVLKALNKKAAHDKEVEKTKKEEHDHRNLYLAKEGLIVEGTPAAQGVSESDLSKRQSLEQKKATKLQSPNFHVSRTRLIMYNVPKSMNEKQLKKLCIDAVTSRATKQKPVIRQIKLLKDSNKGKEVSKNHSRGVAFIEFTEHQHALVALRVLNNNPETFTSEHRPIVEFALDNIQTLRQRNEKIEAQQKGFTNEAQKTEKNTEFHKPLDQSNDKKSRKRKNENGNETERATTDGGKPTKKVKTDTQQEGTRLKRSRDQNPGVVAVPEMRSSRVQKAGQSEDAGSVKRRRNKQNKDPLGQDTVDKLDMLIEQYRSKFTGNRSNESNGVNEGSRKLGRWFQT